MSIWNGDVVTLKTCEVGPLIHSIKKALARKFMAKLNPSFVSDFHKMKFSVPPRTNGRQRSRDSSHSTTASEHVDSNKKVSRAKKSVDGVSSQRISAITEFLLQFEERCFISAIFDSTKLSAFRSLNRGVLQRVVENYGLFRHQPSLPIAINILMFNSSKLQMPKTSFKDLAAGLIKSIKSAGELSIESIKQSSTYALVKQVIRQPI